uniref:Uncharacterized protein n=1 Tax=Neobodo designis TaxID=312471 RepID=A0A7S1Q4V1_NEODS
MSAVAAASIADLLGTAMLVGGVAAALWHVLLSPDTASTNALGHRAVFVASLLLAVAAGLMLASMPATVAGYAQMAIEADGTNPTVPFVSPWLDFLVSAGFLVDPKAQQQAQKQRAEEPRARINSSFDFTFDVVCIHLCLMASYAGAIVVKQLVTTVRLLKAHRRLLQDHDAATFSGSG